MGLRHVPVGTPAEIEAEGAISVDLGDRRVVLVTKLDGQYYAFSNICPHAGFELWPNDIYGDQVYCVGHNWGFDIRTGRCVMPADGPALETLPVEEVDGVVCIRLE